MIQSADDMPEFLRRLAQRAMEDGLMNLTEAERIDVATELYRLADAITVEPVTQGDIDARRQAIRRVAWLTKWLERAMQNPPARAG
jgi:hypothetical protein